MNTYQLHLKSHTDAPDYEDEVDAETRAQAIEMFLDRLNEYGWSRDMIEEHIYEKI